MNCPECGTIMSGPARDYEDVMLTGGKKVYYDVWSCPKCMELVIKTVEFIESIEPWSVS